MTGILAEIVDYKKQFVLESKRRTPQKHLEEIARDAGRGRGFLRALRGPGCALIAEIKSASPSKGAIRPDMDPLAVARAYADNGASCISVLTDEKYFGGSLERLSAVRREVRLPILRKDFIIDYYQIYEARAAGADAVLLIVACLDDQRLRTFMGVTRSLGMDSLVEVHDRGELDRAVAAGAKLIGINNRDLRTFATDIAVTGDLAPFVPPNAVIVSESGIAGPEDVRRIHALGANAVLVGESLMRAADTGAAVRELAGAVPGKRNERTE
jgi:indole-3-glycerol phosphate synthase